MESRWKLDSTHPSRPALGLNQPHTTGTGSSPGVMRPERGVNQPPTPSAVVKGKVELYLCAFIACCKKVKVKVPRYKPKRLRGVPVG